MKLSTTEKHLKELDFLKKRKQTVLTCHVIFIPEGVMFHHQKFNICSCRMGVTFLPGIFDIHHIFKTKAWEFSVSTTTNLVCMQISAIFLFALACFEAFWPIFKTICFVNGLGFLQCYFMVLISGCDPQVMISSHSTWLNWSAFKRAYILFRNVFKSLVWGQYKIKRNYYNFFHTWHHTTHPQ